MLSREGDVESGFFVVVMILVDGCERDRFLVVYFYAIGFVAA